MQPGKDSEGSQARRPVKKTRNVSRRAYNNAMNSRTAGYFGINSTRPVSSQTAGVTESQPAAADSSHVQVQSVDESDEEENSYDKDDDMSEEDEFGDGHIDISDDGNSVENDGGVSQRGNKRKKGIKVAPKVVIQSSSKSVVWDHFEKVQVPSTTQPGVMVIMAQCNYCMKFLSYKADQGGTGATTHLKRHYTKSCQDYKAAMAKMASQTLLNFQPSNATDTGIPVLQPSREYSQEEAKRLIAKMVICHDYPFRMVEHTWFNILMKYMNPHYEFIGRKTIRKECLKVFEAERDSLMKVLKGVDNIALTMLRPFRFQRGRPR